MFGEDTTKLDVTSVCQMGIAKSYQINQLFSKLTVRRNLMISALSRTRGPYRPDMLRNVDHMDELNADIDETLRMLDLTARADMPVSQLAYGEKRRLEIGLALGTDPKILLLDEPLAGMSPTERADDRDAAEAARRSDARWWWSSTTWTRCSAWPTGSPCWRKAGF